MIAAVTARIEFTGLDTPQRGQPVKAGKRLFVKLCNDAIGSWFPGDFTQGADFMDIRFTGRGIRPEAFVMAKAIWDKEKAEPKPAGILSWKKLYKTPSIKAQNHEETNTPLDAN